jgi:FlaA1/EpsC-like NDP-sugar epimerase
MIEMHIAKRCRLYRFVALFGLYSVVSLAAFSAAYLVRFDGNIPSQYIVQLGEASVWVVLVQTCVLVAMGQASVLPTYFSLVDLRILLISNALSCLLFFAAAALLGAGIPRGVMILDMVLLTGGVTTARASLRYWGERRRSRQVAYHALKGVIRPTAIVGAGDAGAAIARELLNKPSLRLKPVVFFDDDPLKWHQRLHGIPIAGKPELLRETRWQMQFRKMIIAMPGASASRLGEIARLAAEVGIPSDTIPALDQLVAGRVKITQLRPVQIEDLLRRSPVLLDQSGIRSLIRDQVVAVTGAGGSIGAELCRQILNQAPRSLVIIDRSEVQLFQIEQELIERGGRGVIVPMVADIADPVRMREILQRHSPDALFHAAAHKHVPMMESQPGEAIRNNSLGTANLTRLAHECGVGRFVLISTDKAINPTNVMGASKRLAEIFLQAFSVANPNPTRFMAVRFGNVLGSSGSVVPIFQKQIAAGGPITVTHPEVTRYFMTIPEAVGLVLQAGALGQGGEIFVLDMGEPVKIVDLATQMIELSGYRAGEDIEIQFSGLRPGEKLFEELSHHKERLTKTDHPKIFRFVCHPPNLSEVEIFLSQLQLQLNNVEPSEIKRSIQRFVPEYRPYIE